MCETLRALIGMKKAEANYRKYGIDFETATETFDDELAIERFDPSSTGAGEGRYLIRGMACGQLVTVVYTERDKVVRLISARKASRREHDNYFRQDPPE
jgi:uncharacterized DUF497 family protein